MQVIEVVAADGEGGAAAAGIVEARDVRPAAGEESLLHFAGDFDFAVDAFALGGFLRDGVGEAAVFEGESGVVGDGGEQAEVAAGVRLFGAFGAETEDAEETFLGGEGQEEFGAEAVQGVEVSGGGEEPEVADGLDASVDLLNGVAGGGQLGGGGTAESERDSLPDDPRKSVIPSGQKKESSADFADYTDEKQK